MSQRATTGKDFWAMWSSGHTHAAPYASIGNIRNFVPSTEGRILRENDSGDRTSFIKQASVSPRVRITFDVQRTTYITRNGIINANGDVPFHSLVWYDGKTYWYMDHAKVDSCRLRTSPGDMLQCEVVVVGSGIHQTTAKTYSGLTEDPLTHEDVAGFTVAGSGWGNWERLEWGCNNNIQSIPLGTNIQPSEIFEQQATHAGDYRISRKWDPTKIDESQDGDYIPIVIAITDHQAVPVTTTFTYSSGVVRNASIEDRDLDMIYEVGSWEAINVGIVRT